MPTGDTLAVFDALSTRPGSAETPQLDVRNGHVVLDFDDSTAEQTDFFGVLPSSYSGGDLTVRIVWAATSGAIGAARWECSFERHSVADPVEGTVDLDSDQFGAAAAVTSDTPGSAGEITLAEVAIAVVDASNPAAGESFRLRVARDAAHADDTLSGDAELFSLTIREA